MLLWSFVCKLTDFQVHELLPTWQSPFDHQAGLASYSPDSWSAFLSTFNRALEHKCWSLYGGADGLNNAEFLPQCKSGLWLCFFLSLIRGLTNTLLGTRAGKPDPGLH